MYEEKIYEDIGETQVPDEPIDIIVIPKKVNLRESPDRNSKILKILKRNDALITPNLDSGGEWIKVYTPPGMEGYILKQYVKEV